VRREDKDAIMLFAQPHTEHETFLGMIAQRWRAWKFRRDQLMALERCGASEVEAIARDLCLPSSQLRKLASKGSDAANPLYRRMADLRLDRAAIGRAQPDVLRDLQITCSLCESKARCIRDIACHAEFSAWSSYCPNNANLRELSSRTAKTPGRAWTGAGSVAIADDHQSPAHGALLGLLLVACAWLILLANPRSLNLPIEPARAPSAVEQTMPAIEAPAAACLDDSCLSVQQQTALQTLRAIQGKGWIGTSIDEVHAIRPASRLVQGVHLGEAAICNQKGGTPHYGFMFQKGCSTGGVTASKRNGYARCEPMAGGGVCLYK
jgi:hypothetical protein